MDIDVTQVFLALMGVLGALITGFVIPWLRSKTTREQQEMINFWLTAAIEAAEQNPALRNKTGAEKKAYVLKFLESKHLMLSPQEVDIALESFVKNVKDGILTVDKTTDLTAK